MKYDLLSVANPKTMKGEKYGFLTAILHLSPSTRSGYNTCPMASVGCAAACLNTAGQGGMFKPGETTNHVQEARIRKTRLFFENRVKFMNMLVFDIERHIKTAHKANLIPTVRLNGTSDIRWETVSVGRFKNIMAAFPDIQFYDYTKLPNRRDLPSNYHLTFSLNESNESHVEMVIGKMNVAVVFRKELPERFTIGGFTLSVVNGDDSDLRFLDPKNCIVGLKAKGRARKDVSGFVKE